MTQQPSLEQPVPWGFAYGAKESSDTALDHEEGGPRLSAAALLTIIAAAASLLSLNEHQKFWRETAAYLRSGAPLGPVISRAEIEAIARARAHRAAAAAIAAPKVLAARCRHVAVDTWKSATAAVTRAGERMLSGAAGAATAARASAASAASGGLARATSFPRFSDQFKPRSFLHVALVCVVVIAALSTRGDRAQPPSPPQPLRIEFGRIGKPPPPPPGWSSSFTSSDDSSRLGGWALGAIVVALGTLIWQQRGAIAEGYAEGRCVIARRITRRIWPRRQVFPCRMTGLELGELPGELRVIMQVSPRRMTGLELNPRALWEASGAGDVSLVQVY